VKRIGSIGGGRQIAREYSFSEVPVSTRLPLWLNLRHSDFAGCAATLSVECSLSLPCHWTFTASTPTKRFRTSAGLALLKPNRPYSGSAAHLRSAVFSTLGTIPYTLD